MACRPVPRQLHGQAKINDDTRAVGLDQDIPAVQVPVGNGWLVQICGEKREGNCFVFFPFKNLFVWLLLGVTLTVNIYCWFFLPSRGRSEAATAAMCFLVGEDDKCSKAWEIQLLAAPLSLICPSLQLPPFSPRVRPTLSLFLLVSHLPNRLSMHFHPLSTSEPVWCVSVPMKRQELNAAAEIEILRHAEGGKKKEIDSFGHPIGLLGDTSSHALGCIYTVSLSSCFLLTASLRLVYKYPSTGRAHSAFVKIQEFYRINRAMWSRGMQHIQPWSKRGWPLSGSAPWK